MRPVHQVRTGYGRGQCTEAAIASLLGVPLDAVPDLWAGPHVPADAPPEAHQPLHNLIRMWHWLKQTHGVQLCGVALAEPMPLRDAWERACSVVVWPVETAEWARFHLASGPNPDGVGHYVVCDRGELAHDPNPSRRGIVACRHVQWLVPLELVPDDARELPSAEWREEAP